MPPSKRSKRVKRSKRSKKVTKSKRSKRVSRSKKSKKSKKIGKMWPFGKEDPKAKAIRESKIHSAKSSEERRKLMGVKK